MSLVKFYVCKTCGRGFASLSPPNFCYADRMDQIEEIGVEENKKMKLFDGFSVSMGTRGYAYEFPGDIQFDPFTGEMKEGATGFKLSDFQDKVMERVRAN